MALRIERTEEDGKSLITVSGMVDLYSSPELRAAILKAVSKGEKALGVDLGGVEYMDSSGVATLIEGLKSAGQKQTAFYLISPSGPVMKVLQLSRLDTVFDIRTSL
ncbi:MAG: STAS domain-containing protein [Candidatus Hydrogenedentes bacterium]|nr:STAS domain-containing protein [Candidatus Hydrogenedentota bacterium]